MPAKRSRASRKSARQDKPKNISFVDRSLAILRDAIAKTEGTKKLNYVMMYNRLLSKKRGIKRAAKKKRKSSPWMGGGVGVSSFVQGGSPGSKR